MSDPTNTKTSALTRINMPSLVEGDHVLKSHITKVFKDEELPNIGLDEYKSKIQPNQVREEGLGPINIGQIQRITATRPHLSVKRSDSIILPGFPQWAPVKDDEGFTNSRHPKEARIEIDWNPERHTHVIFRCSGMVTTFPDQAGGGPEFFQRLWRSGIYQLGLNIVGGTVGGVGALQESIYRTQFVPMGVNYAVWPYTSIRLNPAFGFFANHGFLNKDAGGRYDYYQGLTEEFGTVPDAEFQNEVTELLSEGGDDPGLMYGTTNGVVTSSKAKDYIPNGTWEEHCYDRRSGISQSFTLTAHGTSNDAISNSQNSFKFFNEDKIVCRLMSRNNTKSTGSQMEAYAPRLSNLNMSATIYGR